MAAQCTVFAIYFGEISGITFIFPDSHPETSSLFCAHEFRAAPRVPDSFEKGRFR
jgi:hypothetical protein